MEFPILLALPLPLTALHIVTKFLRQPHPTAKMIGVLTFRRHEAQDEILPEDDEYGYGEEAIKASLIIKGPGVRMLDISIWPPTFVIRNRRTAYNDARLQRMSAYNLVFSYDEVTGESNYKSFYGSDDESEQD